MASRFQAAGIHLAICAFVGSVLLGLFWFVWYPAPLLEAVGGTNIFLILLGIDVALGPLLTLIVFKTGKKSLKADLTAIGTIQVIALCYGVITLLSGRPVYVAALGHLFDVVQASDVNEQELATSSATLPLFGPKWVGIQRATDPKEAGRILFISLGGADYGHFPQHHQPIEHMREEILKNAQTMTELKKLNVGGEATIDAWLSSRRLQSNEVIFQGLRARNKDFSVMLDAKTAKVIGIAEFSPWPADKQERVIKGEVRLDFGESSLAVSSRQ